MIELALRDRQHYKGIPRTRILEVRLRKIRRAVGVRVEDPDHVQPELAGVTVSLEQIRRADLIAILLPARVRVLEPSCLDDLLLVAVNGSDHDAAAFARISSF